MNVLTVGSLFSGIGGFDLGLEWAGMRVRWQCESDLYCRGVLAKHWPGIACYPDIRELRGAELEHVDVLAGGFPCQGLSNAGLRLGLLDPRSGLWAEFARVIGEVRPRYVVVENVSALLVRGFGRVLGDLAALGYDAEWDCIPASAVGAPHQRDRVWLVAYPRSGGLREQPERDQREPAKRGHALVTDDGAQKLVADAARLPRGAANTDADGGRCGVLGIAEPPGVECPPGSVADRLRDPSALADADGPRRARGSKPSESREGRRQELGGRGEGTPADADRERQQGPVPEPETRGLPEPCGESWWEAEPDVGRVADGIPARVDRLRGLGNALVPQIAWWIGSRIVSFEEERCRTLMG